MKVVLVLQTLQARWVGQAEAAEAEWDAARNKGAQTLGAPQLRRWRDVKPTSL